MSDTIILHGITVEDLIERIDKIIEQKVEQTLTKLQRPQAYKYWNSTEVCDFLKISKPTLHAWKKQGLVTAYRISKRIYFRSDEVESSLTKIKYRRF